MKSKKILFFFILLFLVEMSAKVTFAAPLQSTAESDPKGYHTEFLFTADPQYWKNTKEDVNTFFNKVSDHLISQSFPGGIIIAGDLVAGGENIKLYQKAVDPIVSRGYPVYDILGNHDPLKNVGQ